ncbi:class I SAM-dependent methyltransferase [Streptomyces sp. SBT349]|uniref:class I SAM-dependent methyltransferase n=1 Tax=Streptomyces sp. SBT349 TaxID=1580539 RepID=UPI00066EF7EF|nr:class I SAM-dependent methyltransferase [Streptomyces sp. SBT349]
MRMAIRGETLAERLALRARLAPVPAFESMAGMALSGVLVAGARLGILERLAEHPATAEALADDLALRPEPTRLLVEALEALGYLRRRGGRYAPTRRARRWLVPGSDRSVSRFVAAGGEHWEWWAGLPDVVRGGGTAAHHTAPAAAPYWRDYITGQYELARYSAPELASAVRVPPGARSMLDLGGGHGWFAAELCRRNPPMRALVVDLPGSAAVGRDLLAGTGQGRLVDFQEGDLRETDLGTGHDLALCGNLIHHFQPEEILALFRRTHAALRPGGGLAILDLFREREGHRRRRRPSASASCLGLFFHLSSGAAVYSPEQLTGWLTEAGFSPPRRTGLRRIPAQSLYQATALS